MVKTATLTISLGAVSEADVSRIHQWRNDLELSALMAASPVPVSLDQTRSWLQSTQADRNQVILGIFHSDKETAELIGIIRFMYVDWISQVCEFGIYIGPANLRGAGRGAAALKQAIDYAFGFLNMRKVWLRVATTNERALKLYTSFGFRQEGTLVQHFFSGGIFHDFAVMAVHRPSGQ